MNVQNTVEAVIDIAADISGNRPDRAGIDSALDDFGLDSLQHLEMTAAVEDRFGIEISCADRLVCDTVGDMVRLVRSAATIRMPLAA